MEFSENLKQIRIKKGFSQKEIAERLGVSQPSYAQYESGKRKPKLETLQKIADALDIKISELISLNDAIGSALEVIEENRITHAYSAVEIAIKDNLDKLNNTAKKKVYDYTEDLIQNPQNLKDTEE